MGVTEGEESAWRKTERTIKELDHVDTQLRPRKLMEGSPAVCIAGIIGLASVSLDEPIQHAIICFGVALPMLMLSSAFYRVRARPHGFGRGMVEMVQLSAQVVEAIAEALVWLGVANVLMHYSQLSGIVYVIAGGLTFPMVWIGAVVVLILYAIYKVMLERKGQRAQAKSSARQDGGTGG